MGYYRRGLSARAVIAASLFLTAALSAEPTKDLLQKASDSFAKRSAQDDDPALLDTIALLKDVSSANATTSEEKAAQYRALILLSRTYYIAGSLVPYDERSSSAENLKRREKRLALLDAGRNAALAAQKIDDKHAESYYYYAINLSRWAVTTGIQESLGRRKELNTNVVKAKTKLTLDGKKGDSLDGYGPLRTEGRAAYKLPPGFGQSKSLSYSALKAAAEKAPYVAANQLFFASTLRWKGEKDARGRDGKQIIAGLIGNATSAEEAADRFIESFRGTPFEEAAKSRRPETIKDFIEDIKEPAAYVGLTVPWIK